MAITDIRSGSYWAVGVLFLVLSIVSFVPALVFLYHAFYGKALFLFGYAFLNGLFAYGLWKRAYWIVLLSLINLGGILLVKLIGLAQGVTTMTNLLITVCSAAILAGFTYATRRSLSGPFLSLPITIVYLIVLVPVLLRSIGVL